MTNQPRRDCQFSCDRCGISTAVRCDLPVIHGCGGQPAQRTMPTLAPAGSTPLPGIIKRAGRYTKAVSKWIAAGRPTRSQDEIDALLAICQGCEHFNAEASACRRCGCNINNQASGLANKLAMATEHCPEDPPRW